MDSLSQIVLGAAVGEAALGKKIGNRAMIWGAVGGTIPDLDVVSDFFMSAIDSLAFHRGISHSLFFSVIGAFFFGWLVHSIYKSPYHKWIAVVTQSIAALTIIYICSWLIKRVLGLEMYWVAPIALLIIPLTARYLRNKYFTDKWERPAASVKEWQWMFFLALFTHPILDCFTMYGTQLFAPFSDYRVAFSTVSVADPLYTAPFLLCLLVASRFAKDSSARRKWNYAGLIISCSYLLFTSFNKLYINGKFEDALAKQGIEYSRYISNATILNNILWTATVETEDNYLQGQYSWFDEVDIEFSPIEKNHELLKNTEQDKTIQTLKWFSKDYYNVTPRGGNKFQFNDLRFGTFSGEAKGPDDYIFRFQLEKKGDQYEMLDAMGGPPDGGGKDLMKILSKRIKGKKKNAD